MNFSQIKQLGTTALLVLAGHSTLFAEVSDVEREALVSLYQHTDGAHWKHNTNWMQGDPCENEWYGITCNRDKQTITKIKLNRNQLDGVIPPTLGALESLRYLSLGDNDLKGQIPASLGVLSSLRDLRLYKNCLMGQIPASLGNLSKLRTLNLSKNRLSGVIPATLGELSELRYLTLGGNRLMGAIPMRLGSLSNLRHLRLYSNRLTGTIPSTLGNLSKLKTLHLYRNHITGMIPDSLGNLGKLESLKLGRNQLILEIPESLMGLTKLKDLYLERNKLMGEIPESIQNLTNLECLRLYKNCLSSEDEAVNAFVKRIPKCFTNIHYQPKCGVGTECSQKKLCREVGSHNFLANGSFEAFAITNDHGRWKNVTFTGWQGAGEVWSSGLGKMATKGDHKIELDTGRGFNTLTQAVEGIKAGHTYLLSLDAYARKVGSSDFELWMGSHKIATVRPSKSWKRHNFEFTATASMPELSIKELAGQNDSYGAILDNITITEIITKACH